MAMAGPDLSPMMAPLSPLSSEVEVHPPSVVATETSAHTSRVEVGTSPVALAAPHLVPESQETFVQTEEVLLTTSTTHSLLHLDPGKVVLIILLVEGKWWLSEASCVC